MALAAALMILAGCGGGGETPTRTPFPTWTPTPSNGQAAAAPQPANEQPAAQNQGDNSLAVAAAPAAGQGQDQSAATLVPATATPTLTPTPLPTATPTETPIPTPLPTPNFTFDLEAAEKFPTESLAANVVRIFLYVHSPTEFALPDYSLLVIHNQAPLQVAAVSGQGLPAQTRTDPGPYTRFTNMDVIFAEPQAGTWEVALIDSTGAIVGPPATFELTADEKTRELYLRYRQK